MFNLNVQKQEKRNFLKFWGLPIRKALLEAQYPDHSIDDPISSWPEEWRKSLRLNINLGQVELFLRRLPKQKPPNEG